MFFYSVKKYRKIEVIWNHGVIGYVLYQNSGKTKHSTYY